MRRCSRDERHVQNLSDGTCVFVDLRLASASWLARKNTVATFSASEGWNWKGPSESAGGAVGRGADEVDNGQQDRKDADGARGCRCGS